MTVRAVRRTAGAMNNLEAAYAEHLEARRITGEILWFRFDTIKLRLAKATFYSPDFMVVLANHEIEIHEVKGHWEDDARVKIKVAADIYPFRFLAVTRPKKSEGWKFESFGHSALAHQSVPKSDAGPLTHGEAGWSPRRRPVVGTRTASQPESEVMPNNAAKANSSRAARRDNASPLEGGRRTIEAEIAAWKPGDPIPPRCPTLNGKPITSEYAKELLRK